MKRYFLIMLPLMLLFAVPASAQKIKERISQIKKADPVTMSGNVGTSVGLSYNSKDVAQATPFTGTVYANLNFNIYSFKIPFSFYLVNNTTSFSYPQMPMFYFGLTPTWRNWKFHIGHSSMHFSNYTYSGITFLGGGFEYTGRFFRAAAFYGLLQQASRQRGYDDRSKFQQLSDSLLGLNAPETDLPQYRRDGMGVKIGVGNARNFLDISVFKAVDKENSLPSEWRDTVKAKDNIALGLAGRFCIGSWFNFNANLGASVITQDLSDSIAFLNDDFNKIINELDGLIGVRNNTQVRFAGDVAMNFNSSVFNGGLTYRAIQSGYSSLGIISTSQNVHSIGLMSNFNMFKGKTLLGFNGYLQRDNLDEKQMYTNQVATYNVTFSSPFGNVFSLAASYNGIKQDQLDGTCIVADSMRVDQIMHTATLSPTLTFQRKNTHSYSLNFSYMQNMNLNELSDLGMDVTTLSAGVGYNIDFSNQKLGLNFNYDLSKTMSESTDDYLTNSLSAGFNYKMLENETMSWSMNYNMSVGYNTVLDGDSEDLPVSEEQDGETAAPKYDINSVSFSNSVGSNFSYKKRHNASLYLSMSNYSNNIIFGQKIAADMDLRFTFSYSYAFAARLIKRKVKEEQEFDPLKVK